MNKYNQINILQYGIVIYFVLRAMSLGIAVNSYINIGGLDGYLCPFIGMFIGFIPLFIFLSIYNYQPDLNIFEKIDYLFKKTGKFINLLIIIGVIILVVILYWDLLNFIVSQYLFRTSVLLVAGVFSICFIYSNIFDIKVLFRVSNILFYISIVIFLICIIGSFKTLNISNALPFLEKGIIPPLIGSFSHITYSILPLFILLLIPKNSIVNNDKSTMYILIFYILASITKVVVTFITISTFGIELSKLYEFPDFLVLSKISNTGFFQRFESILATQWIIDIYVLITLGYQYIKEGYKHYINKNTNIFISIIIILSSLFASKFLFINNAIADNFILYKFPFVLTFFFLIIPVIIFIKIKRTK